MSRYMDIYVYIYIYIYIHVYNIRRKGGRGRWYISLAISIFTFAKKGRKIGK